ncbi:MAG: amidohydrolase family protein [archaeon]
MRKLKKEAKNCLKKNNMSPVKYLEGIGLLGKKLVAAHCIWVSKRDINALKKHGVRIAHCPTADMKLADGVMPYRLLKESNLTMGLGTDGPSSNNNLDMFEAMKIASLLQKSVQGRQTAMPAPEAFSMATRGGADALGLDLGIKEGNPADIVLVDLNRPELTPHYNLVSDIVYSANGSCADTVICDGRVLMENRQVRDEDKILEQARDAARRLTSPDI